MDIRWLTGVVDRPSDSFDPTVAFWAEVTGSSPSSARGGTGEATTLVPSEGDAYLRIQRSADGSAGSHLEVHVDDADAFARRAVAAGAARQQGDDVVRLRSPAGLSWSAVTHRGEHDRPPPQPAGDTGCLHLVDQLCIDIPAARFVEECAFWSDVTGWEQRQSSVRSEFRYLVRPAWCPLRLLLQRCDDREPARAHLDLASSDVDEVVAHHVRLGATVVQPFEHWTVMADPSGTAYCVTARDPTTGVIKPSD